MKSFYYTVFVFICSLSVCSGEGFSSGYKETIPTVISPSNGQLNYTLCEIHNKQYMIPTIINQTGQKGYYGFPGSGRYTINMNKIIDSCLRKSNPIYNKPFRIRSKVAKRVLEASKINSKVKLQSVNGKTTQLWILRPTDSGKQNIVNIGTGGVLSVEKGDMVSGRHLLTKKKANKRSEEWYLNSDGTIETAAAKNLVMNVYYKKNISLHDKTGWSNQKFYLEF